MISTALPVDHPYPLERMVPWRLSNIVPPFDDADAPMARPRFRMFDFPSGSPT